MLVNIYALMSLAEFSYAAFNRPFPSSWKQFVAFVYAGQITQYTSVIENTSTLTANCRISSKYKTTGNWMQLILTHFICDQTLLKP